MKTYVLMISRYFLKSHPRAGETTLFTVKILNNKLNLPGYWCKLHTIRGNYELWKKRIDEVNAGHAELSLRYWTASPYNYKRDGSKQIEFLRLKKGECGIQKFQMDAIYQYKIDGKRKLWCLELIAENDGLSVVDFKAWFKNYDPKPMAIIHFTNKVYEVIGKNELILK